VVLSMHAVCLSLHWARSAALLRSRVARYLFFITSHVYKGTTIDGFAPALSRTDFSRLAQSLIFHLLCQLGARAPVPSSLISMRRCTHLRWDS
jgi:hypothetical protein